MDMYIVCTVIHCQSVIACMIYAAMLSPGNDASLSRIHTLFFVQLLENFENLLITSLWQIPSQYCLSDLVIPKSSEGNDFVWLNKLTEMDLRGKRKLFQHVCLVQASAIGTISSVSVTC